MVIVVGIDIGGSKIAAGLVSRNKVLNKKIIPTPKTSRELLSAIIRMIEDVGINQKHAKGIGIGVAGSVDSKGNWLKSPNIPCVNNLPLKRILEKRFHKRVEINNDANCFALEEALAGAGKKSRSVFGLILGTGTGGGIVIDRKLYNGADFLAGEVGMINYKGKSIGDFCSAVFIRLMAAEYGLKTTKPKEVAELALKGNGKAKKIYEQFGENVGYLLSIIVCALNPDIIVIGGGLSGSFGLFRKSMLKSMKENLFYKGTWKTRVVKSASKEAGIAGAAALLN
ncbi:MAG: ROK family protein [Candidatus Woesearchaeota archaeon]|nr:ROK family protein [Candidatus Woesearchaeota archaeon]